MNKIILLILVSFLFYSCKKENVPLSKDSSTLPETPKEMSYEDFKTHCLNHLQSLSQQHESLWDFGNGENWQADLNKGTIQWIFADKVVSAPIQVICTYNTEKETLLWGWDHPSVPKALTQHAEKVKEYGLKYNKDELTTRLIKCSEEDAWSFAAMAVKLANSQGAYRGPSDSTMVFFSFGEIKIEKRTNDE